MVPHVHGFITDFATNPRYGRFRQATVPRSWFKTWTWTVGKSIWLTLPDEEGLYKDIYPYKGPNVRILIASNVVDNAAKMVNKIKSEWESNDRLRAAFPELIPEFNKTRWSDHLAQVKRTINAQEGTYNAVGVGGSVISQHFDHITEDDIVYAKKDDFTGMELMPSQEDIDNAIGWHKLAFSLLVDPGRSCIDYVGTRWAPHDPIDYIRRHERRYACFEICATKEGIWPIPDDSFCWWPERYGKQVLESIRESQGPKIFETQYLNRPRAGEDITFELEYLHRHDTLEEYPQDLNWYTIVDLASWKDKKRICNNVVLTGAVDTRNHMWIGRVDAGRYNPTDVIELIKQHNRQFSSRVYVEEVGYQVSLRHFAKIDMQTEGSHQYHINQLPSDNRKNAKDLRIESLQPVVKNGAMHVLRNMRTLIQELEDYPYAHTKDVLDVMGFLLRHARPRSIVTRPAPVGQFTLESILKELKGMSDAEKPLFSREREFYDA